MRELFYDRCVHTGNTELLEQWDERNAPLTPKTVSYGSNLVTLQGGTFLAGRGI